VGAVDAAAADAFMVALEPADAAVEAAEVAEAVVLSEICNRPTRAMKLTITATAHTRQRRLAIG